jgi:hypothetical protein
MSQLRQSLEGGAEEGEEEGEGFQPELAEHSLTVCTQQLERMFDDQYGGFGGELVDKPGWFFFPSCTTMCCALRNWS